MDGERFSGVIAECKIVGQFSCGRPEADSFHSAPPTPTLYSRSVPMGAGLTAELLLETN